MPIVSNPGQVNEAQLISKGVSLLDTLIEIFTRREIEPGDTVSAGNLIDDKRELDLQLDVDYFIEVSTAFGVSQWDGMWGEFSLGTFDDNGKLIMPETGKPINFSATLRVPEPFTFIASGLAIGFGVLCQREYTKNRHNKK